MHSRKLRAERDVTMWNVMMKKVETMTRPATWMKSVSGVFALTIFLLLLVVPNQAQAWPGKTTSCTSCHTAADTTNATITTAIDGVVGTSVTVPPGGSFEVDARFTNMTPSGETVAMQIAVPGPNGPASPVVPTDWGIAAGTANSPAIPGWNSVWDIAGSNGAGTSDFFAPGGKVPWDTSGNYPNTSVGNSIDYTNGGWGPGGNTGAYDDVTNNPGLDGVANDMGFDAIITVPTDTPVGTYSVIVQGIGHTDGGSTKGHITQIITVTVSSGGDVSAPTEVAASLNVTPESGSFVGSPVTITEQFNDAESAVTTCEYTTDGGSGWNPGVVSGAGPYTCTASGVVMANGVGYTIQMRATSGGGTSAPTQSLIRTGDTAAPITTDNAPAGWQLIDQTIALSPNDGAGSGVTSTEWCVDTANSCTPNVDGTSFGTGTTVNVTETAGNFSTQYVRYRSIDNLGNTETTKSSTVQIDKEVPVDGTLSIIPNDGQLNLSWTAPTEGNALASPAYKLVRADATTTPPADCSGVAVYQGDLTSYNDPGLTNGVDYAYRVCATDVAGNVSTGAINNAQPAAVCTSSDPTVTITTGNQQITAGSGNVVYNVDVTNNDTAACGDTTFSLSANDGNATDFTSSVLGTTSLLVSPSATQSTTLTVTAVASPTNGATNDSSVTSAAAGPHGAVVSNSVTTPINIPTTSAINYNVGETVHVEFRTATRFNSQGTGALSVGDSAGGSVLTAINMFEVQQGAQWIYTYDWDTTGQPADTYRVEVWDSGDTIPIAEMSIILNNPSAQINLFADAGYTTPTDIFADGSTIYVEVLLPSAETAITSSDVNDWYGNTAVTSNNITQTGTVFRYDFTVDFVTAGIADGDWGYIYWKGTDTVIDMHRAIQRNDAGCGSCTYADPTATIVTANQEINTDAGSVNYTINVTNNDSVACGSTDFNLTLVDTNSTEFDPSTFGVDPLTVNPGATGNTTITVTAKTGFTSATNDTYFFTEADGNHGQSANSATRTTTLNVIDLVAPTVDSFTIPATSTSQTVSITAFTASDAVGVTGYMVTESAVAPGSGDAGWTGTAPTSYTVASDGSYTLYAWAKDAQGNVSTSLSDSVDVDSAVPTVTAFTVPTPQGSATVSITTFTASDNIGVTGYLITENSTPPSPGAAGWTGIAPGSYTVSSGDGSYTLHAWAKDAVGNVSAFSSAPVTVDTQAPSVQSTDPADAAPAAPLNGAVTINWDENIDCATVTTANITSTSPGWSLSTCSGSQAIFNTSLQNYVTSYTVTVSTNVTDLTGNPMASSYPFSYTTEAEACIYNDPTITIAEANQDVTSDNGFVDYTVTVNNNDTGSCGDTTFDLLATENPGTADFSESFPGTNQITLSPGTNGNVTVRTTATNGVLNGATQTLDIKTDGSGDVNHNDSNLISRTTTLNVPCNVAPSASFVTANQQITTDGGSAAYTIQVQNDNALACGSADFGLVVVDDNGTAFSTPSVFTTDPLTVAPNGGTNTTTLTVTAQAGATNGATNNSYFYTAVNGSIPQSGNSATRTTTINRPCVRNAPSFSHAVNQNIATDGTAVYTLTVINNDVDCADTTFTLSVDSEVESNAAAFDEVASDLSTTSVTVASGATDTSVTYSAVGTGSGVENDTLTTTLTLSDATNHGGQDQSTIPVTTIKPFNPLVHSSLSTASTKHSGDGGWGLAGSRYGEFTCATCHSNNKADTGNNIKRIRETITTPDTAIATLPGDGVTVTFTDATEPTTDFGDDADIPRTTNRICEVCHTYDATKAAGTNKHAFNQPSDSGHENGNDCINCHKHSAGFGAAGGTCDGCHGYPPSPGDASTTPARTDDGKAYQAVEGKGAHVEHVNHLAALTGITLDPNVDDFGDANVTAICGVCHDMNSATHEMGGGAAANRNINFNSSTTFQFGASAPAYNGVEDVSSATTPKTCSNLSCHFQDSPWWE